jgi:hypothetical protein
MAKAKKRFYEIAPGWAFGRVPIKLDAWEGGLTTSMSFEYMETRYAKKIGATGQLPTKPRTIPDLIATGGGVPVVTSAIKSVLEVVAPHETEFRPFALRWQDDTPVPGEARYICNILNRVDCFDFAFLGEDPPKPATVSQSGEYLTPDESWLREGYTNRLTPRPDHVDPAAVGGLQIWRPRWCAKRIFITSDLLKKLRGAGVKGLHVDRLKTRGDP